MGEVIECQVSNFPTAAYIAIALLQEEDISFVLGQRDIATKDDEDHAHLFVCQILGALKKGNCSSRRRWPLLDQPWALLLSVYSVHHRY